MHSTSMSEEEGREEVVVVVVVEGGGEGGGTVKELIGGSRGSRIFEAKRRLI